MLNETEQKMLHYNVMKTGLAVLAHQGESTLFGIIDDAMRGPNWEILEKIEAVIDRMPPDHLNAIFNEAGQIGKPGKSSNSKLVKEGLANLEQEVIKATDWAPGGKKTKAKARGKRKVA